MPHSIAFNLPLNHNLTCKSKSGIAADSLEPQDSSEHSLLQIDTLSE